MGGRMSLVLTSVGRQELEEGNKKFGDFFKKRNAALLEKRGLVKKAPPEPEPTSEDLRNKASRSKPKTWLPQLPSSSQRAREKTQRARDHALKNYRSNSRIGPYGALHPSMRVIRTKNNVNVTDVRQYGTVGTSGDPSRLQRWSRLPQT